MAHLIDAMAERGNESASDGPVFRRTPFAGYITLAPSIHDHSGRDHDVLMPFQRLLVKEKNLF
jgi:hypothetical protein